MKNIKEQKRIRRHTKIRAQALGTKERPRLCVYKSNTGIYGQLIDDVNGITLVAVSDKKMAGGSKAERAHQAGKAIAELAKKNKIEKVVFDRGGFIYIGRIKAFADGAREGGLIF